jgi:hypothetical protein
MNLKNYTSTVSALTTISYIEQFLADAGVTGITKEFDSKKQPSAVLFHVNQGEKNFTVKLPARVSDVHEYLWRDYITSHSRPKKTKDDFLEQASRTAWKIQLDWVQVQISLIKLKQADVLQVFMAYIWDGEQTVYERIKGTGFKALPQST